MIRRMGRDQVELLGRGICFMVMGNGGLGIGGEGLAEKGLRGKGLSWDGEAVCNATMRRNVRYSYFALVPLFVLSQSR